MSEDGVRPLVTFFVVAYNQEATVRAAVESAFAQTWRPLEILLSDDASGDRTFAVMQELAAGYAGPHRVRVNRNVKNLGIPGHIDRIMQLAEGAFVVQNAGDDVSAPERAERLVAAWLASGGRAKAVHSAKLRMDEAGRVHGLLPEREPLNRHPPLALLRRPPDIYGAAMGWARELFEVFGPLGPKPLLEDYPICLRAATLGEVVYLEEPLLHYRSRRALGARDRDDGLLRALRLPAEAPAVAPVVQPALPRRHGARARRRTPRPAGRRREKHPRLRPSSWRWRRWAAARGCGRCPGRSRTSLRHRDAAPLRKNLKYLLDAAYMRWLDRRPAEGPRGRRARLRWMLRCGAGIVGGGDTVGLSRCGGLSAKRIRRPSRRCRATPTRCTWTARPRGG